jgi:hypothetical protein
MPLTQCGRGQIWTCSSACPCGRGCSTARPCRPWRRPSAAPCCTSDPEGPTRCAPPPDWGTPCTACPQRWTPAAAPPGSCCLPESAQLCRPLQCPRMLLIFQTHIHAVHDRRAQIDTLVVVPQLQCHPRRACASCVKSLLV